jgi:hypothetical protein
MKHAPSHRRAERAGVSPPAFSELAKQPPTVRGNVKEIQMPKGQQRGNREAKKPKQPKKAPTPPWSSVVPSPESVRLPGKMK